MPHYTDLQKQKRKTSMTEVMQSVERIVTFFDALDGHFFERQDVIKKLKLAMMLREHLLLIGPPGTGKTALFNKVFGSIQDAETWSLDLTKFTTDTHLFGSYDQRELERTGHMVHMTDGTLGTANFAHLGEFFDGNDPILRTLLGVLNGGSVKKGPQVIRMPLLTVVADTNFRPEDMPTRADQLRAVVDRFLFKSEVGYVQDPSSDFSMHEAFLSGDFDKPLPPLYLKDVEVVSGLVVGHTPNIFRDRYVLEAYVELKREASRIRMEDGRPPISDRRSMKAAQLVEVSALMNGRVEAKFDDLWAVQSVLSETLEDRPVLQERAEAVVQKWVEKQSRHSIEAELAEVKSILAKVPSNVQFDSLSSAEVLTLKDTLTAVSKEVESYVHESLEAGKACREGILAIIRMQDSADNHILDLVESSIPDNPDKVDIDSVASASKVLSSATSLLKKVSRRGSTDILVRQSRLQERAAMAQEFYARTLAAKEVDDLKSQWYGT